jgi:hypothetical protein
LIAARDEREVPVHFRKRAGASNRTNFGTSPSLRHDKDIQTAIA